MTASIIVATYNRAALLDECLAHLAKQHYLPGDEVLVVDNGSTDDTPQVVTSHTSSFPVPLKLMHEPRPGKSKAIAAALAAATGELVAFTDDDVLVDEGWLGALRGAMGDGTAALVGGPVAARWEGRPPSWMTLDDPRYAARFSTPLAIANYGPTPMELGDRTAMGANLAVRRDVFEHLGGFAPHLGKLRGTLMSGEDDDLCRRVQALGLKTLYCPTALVHHWVPASRARLRYYLPWFFWWGITHAAIHESGASHKDHSPQRDLTRHFLGRLVKGAMTAPAALVAGRAPAAVSALLDASYSLGYLFRRWRLVRHGQTEDVLRESRLEARQAL